MARRITKRGGTKSPNSKKADSGTPSTADGRTTAAEVNPEQVTSASMEEAHAVSELDGLPFKVIGVKRGIFPEDLPNIAKSRQNSTPVSGRHDHDTEQKGEFGLPSEMSGAMVNKDVAAVAAPAPAASVTWECPKCTYHNASTLQCEMCSAPKPPAAAGTAGTAAATNLDADAMRNLIKSKYKVLNDYVTKQQNCSSQDRRLQVDFAKSKSVFVPNWLVPFWFLQKSACMRLNHEAGYGCTYVDCDYLHICLLCGRKGHGYNQRHLEKFKCRWHQGFWDELSQLEAEVGYRIGADYLDELFGIHVVREFKPSTVPSNSSSHADITASKLSANPTPTLSDWFMVPPAQSLLTRRKLTQPTDNSSNIREETSSKNDASWPVLGRENILQPTLQRTATLSAIKSDNNKSEGSNKSEASSVQPGSDTDDTADTDDEEEGEPIIYQYKLDDETRLEFSRHSRFEIATTDHTAVYRALYFEFGQHREVAVKLWPIPLSKEVAKKNRQQLIKEYDAIRAVSLQTPHVVTHIRFNKKLLYPPEVGSEYYALIMELCKMTLAEFIVDPLQPPLDVAPGQTRSLIQQLLVAYQCCHRAGVTHRDVKPENILVNKENGADGFPQLHLCDFAFSHLPDKPQSGASTVRMSTYIGTIDSANNRCWVAPEVLNLLRYNPTSPGSYTKKADIFSLGCVIYFVRLKGKVLFRTADETLRSESPDIHREFLERDGLHKLDPLAFHLIQTMTKFNEKERPTADECARHPAVWPRGKVSEFLAKIKDVCDAHVAGAVHIMKELENRSKEAMGVEDWTTKMPSDYMRIILSQINKAEIKKESAKRPIQLLRHFRNLVTHFGEQWKATLGAYTYQDVMQQLADHIMQSFPNLVPVLYEICQKYMRFDFGRDGVTWDFMAPGQPTIELRSKESRKL